MDPEPEARPDSNSNIDLSRIRKRVYQGARYTSLDSVSGRENRSRECSFIIYVCAKSRAWHINEPKRCKQAVIRIAILDANPSTQEFSPILSNSFRDIFRFSIISIISLIVDQRKATQPIIDHAIFQPPIEWYFNPEQTSIRLATRKT